MSNNKKRALLQEGGDKAMDYWTTEWPEEKGWFWFYGQQFGKGRLELFPVKVRGPIRNSQKGQSFMYIAGGAFMYPSEAVGAWLKMDVPKVPDDPVDEETRA